MTPAVELCDVSLRIDGTSILHKVSWQVATHERWVVVGANGAGKTSLLRIASLFLHPSQGTVRCLGRELGHCDLRVLRRRTSLSSVALTAKLEPTMTAAQVVMTARYGALAHWWHHYDDSDVDRAVSLLSRFGVSVFADRTLDTLSAGERQKVLLARTLMNAPEIVFLDEPTSGLDIGAREVVLGDLSDLAADPDSPSVVVVTHHLEEVPTSFTHALVLKDGKVLAQGPIVETLTSTILSDAYQVPLMVEHNDGRFTARLVTS